MIFFDGNQTLWDFQALMRRTLAATIEELRRQEPTIGGDLSVEVFIADREAAADQLRGNVTNLESIRLAAFTRSLLRLGIADARLAGHLNNYYLQRRFADVDLYDDVPVLDSLIRDHSLGLPSSGNSYPDRAGLGRFFTATVFSQDHGVEKPDPRIYSVAQAAIPGGEYIMVGDSIANDIVAAQRVGWKGIWLNRDRRDLPAGVRPDAILTSLYELPPLIDPADATNNSSRRLLSGLALEQAEGMACWICVDSPAAGVDVEQRRAELQDLRVCLVDVGDVEV